MSPPPPKKWAFLCIRCLKVGFVSFFYAKMALSHGHRKYVFCLQDNNKKKLALSVHYSSDATDVGTVNANKGHPGKIPTREHEKANNTSEFSCRRGVAIGRGR